MKRKFTSFAFGLLAVSALASQVAAQGFQLPLMIVESDAFESGDVIPLKYTSHGENVQPDFTITGAPEETESYAVIFHDIDVALGDSTEDVLHWTAWNINDNEIQEGSLPEGAVQGANITGQNNYMGPGAPSSERYHHYVWEFYALDEDLDLEAGASRQELLDAMDGNVVAKAAYVGRYRNASEEANTSEQE